MEHDRNLVISSMSKTVIEEGVPFRIEIHKLEGDPIWTLEVVTRDGTSITWDDPFDTDELAFNEAVSTIREEGAQTFERGGSNVIPFRRSLPLSKESGSGA